MSLDPKDIAQSIVEEMTLDAGPCIYPGGFKPPHKGHYGVVKNLAARNYITEVHIVISPKPRDGITAKQSLETWRTFLECAPIPKARVIISPYPSPVLYAYKFIEARPTQKPIYIAGGSEDVGDQAYFASLQKRFGDQVLSISIPEEEDRISGTKTRDYLRSGDYDRYKESVPEAVNSKGKTPYLFKMLSSTIEQEAEPINEQEEESSEGDLFRDFLTYCYGLLGIKQPPEIQAIDDINFPRQNFTFGHYNPASRDIVVYVGNRNLADIMRTVAHEMVHHRQNELGILQATSGDTGSEIENEANAVAAIIMREFGKKNPEIYE